MTLTASDVASVSRSIERWEIAEYVFSGLVGLACAGEYIADFTNLFTGGVKERKERLAKLSALVLIAALMFEVLCVQRTNALSGMLIGSLREEAEQAKSPRSLTNIPELISKLEPFRGTEYTFSGVFGDEESVMLLRAIDDALHRAGWKRVPPAHSFPMINVYGKEVDFAVPDTMYIGLQVFVDSPEPNIESVPLDRFSPLVKAAVALNMGLQSSVFPPNERKEKRLQVTTGTSTVVRITVGRKM